MKHILATLLVCGLALGCSAHAEEYTGPSTPIAHVDGMPVYGTAMPEGDAIGIAKALQQVDALADSAHKFEGRIAKVCQTKGCWLVLADGEHFARVMFGKHDFYIPKDTSGEAVVYGTLTTKTVDEAMAKHLTEDAGGDPDSVHGEMTEYRITATSVMLRPSAG